MVATSATVEPVTWAFFPMTAAVPSVRLTDAEPLLKSPRPPLSLLPSADVRRNVVAATLTLPPARIVVPVASTCGLDESPEMVSGPVPMKAELLSVPLIEMSTLATAMSPPEPFDAYEVPLVRTVEAMVTSPPTVTVEAARNALTEGLMVVPAVGTLTLRMPPPPPFADELDCPSPGGGAAARSEDPSGESSFCWPARSGQVEVDLLAPGGRDERKPGQEQLVAAEGIAEPVGRVEAEVGGPTDRAERDVTGVDRVHDVGRAVDEPTEGGRLQRLGDRAGGREGRGWGGRAVRRGADRDDGAGVVLTAVTVVDAAPSTLQPTALQ